MHSTIKSNGNTWPIQHMRSDLTCFIAGQAAGHTVSDGCITAALKAVVWGASKHLHDLRIVPALAYHQGRWGG